MVTGVRSPGGSKIVEEVLKIARLVMELSSTDTLEAIEIVSEGVCYSNPSTLVTSLLSATSSFWAIC